MALMVHSGEAALDLGQQVEHWDLAGTSVGELLNLNGQYYQVLSISGRDVAVGRIYPSTASFSVLPNGPYVGLSTSTRHGVYLSGTIQTQAPAVKLPPPPGPPADLEPPVWPLWLRLTPPEGTPPPVCLEIPAVGDLIFHPQFRGGERIDPITRLTPSEEAAWKARQRQAKEDWEAMQRAEQVHQQSRGWKFWRKSA